MSATCQICAAPLVEIVIPLSEDDMVMASCSNCDRRSWRGRGTRGKVPIEHVLDGIHNDRARVRSRRTNSSG